MKSKSTFLKIIGLIMLSLFLWWGNTALVNAQVSDYTFSSTVGTYTEITGGTLVATSVPGLGVDYLDDNTYANQPIPFPFTFNGVTYSSLNINTNGFITFGTILTNSYSPISATLLWEGVAAIIANDLDARFTTQAMTTIGSTTLTGVLHFGAVAVGKPITGTNIPAGTTITAFDAGAQTITLSQAATATSAALVTIVVYNGDIRTQTLGSAPNRVHVIQFRNFKRWGSGSTIYNGEMMNFQIRLHETTNNIQYVYGNFIITSTTARTSQVGLRGAVNTDYLNRMTVIPHDWTATAPGVANNSSCSFLNSGYPPMGLTFLFEAPAPPTFGDVAGIVKDAANGNPIIGAHVMTGDHSMVTLADGAFYFEELQAGPNTITVHKAGYNTLNEVVTIIGGQTVNYDLLLNESANVPGPVLAELNAAATAVNLSWGLPQGLYEIIYDDGVAETATAWGLGGNMNALRFTPAGYPAKIMSGSVNIYDGTYPPAGNPLLPFQMAVYDATGPIGYPGNELGVVDVTPDDAGWVSFDLSGLDITIASGDFYLVMIQGGNFPNCAPIAVDQTNPVMRSYSRFVTGGAPWTPAGFNDFMMRAIVQGPGGPEFLTYGTGELVESSRISEGALFLHAPQHTIAEVGMGVFKPIEGTGVLDRNVLGYRVHRFAEGEEGNMAAWSLLGNPTGTALVDNSWPDLGDGAYRWAVQAKYPGDVFSAPTFSNVLRKNWASNVTINVTLSDPNISLAGIQVGLTNTAFPQYAYNGTTNADGVVNFPEVWKGNYNLVVYKFGFDPYSANFDITTNTYTRNVLLLETTYPPSALYVNPVTLFATWVAPGVSLDLLEENWSSGNFTANEWTFDPAQGNWAVNTFNGNPAPSAQFNWSPSVTNYSNALVSKQLSGLGMPSVMLKYDLFLSNFSTATLEQFAVEVWNGSTWVQVANYTNAGGSIPWTAYTHNITSHAQGQQFKVRFRAYGANSFNINNWNVDNIMVYGEVADGGDRGVIGYYVYLDDLVAGFTSETNFTFSPQNVAYGETYTAGVKAVYESGFSPLITYNFTSQWLAKPRNLEGEDIDHGVTLTWDAPIIPESYEFIPSADPIVVTDMNADISPVSYQISGEPTRALFDLLASFPVGDVGGTYSVATDGQFVYSARWNALLFHKYTMSGTLIESFTIPGAGNIRDLTYDGEFFYGAPNSTTIYKMNFATQTLVSTITAPAAVRGIAYDATNDGFWITNGWDGPLRLISRTGTTLQTLTTAAASMAGLAWDNISEGGPYLWAYTQTGSLHVLAKINLTTGAIIQTFDVATLGITGVGSSAGGLFITNLMIPGKWTFAGCSQNDIFWVLELADDQGGGGGGTIVEPFAYNVYKDGALLATVDGDLLTYTDQPIVAGTYSYAVSALYEYGTDLVESPLEGPIDVVVAPGFGFVQGIVFDCATFQPIGGVTITAGDFSTTTQANGTYSLVAHEGVYDIHFDKIGYALHVEEDFEIVWQQTKTLNVCLTEKEPNFPFTENWSSGSFTTQGWTFVPAQGNWRMSTSAGNPAPSAEFYWSPSATNYSNALTSVEIDARAALQNVTLTYAIFLDNYSATSAEKMTVEIWDGEEWVFVAEYKNDNDIPWTTHSHDVTEHAAGKMTRVRFVANGANSFNINWWYLDNIMLHEVLPPEISVTPAELFQALVVGTTATQELTVNNIGDGALNFTTQVEYLDKSNEFIVYPVEPGEKVVISGMDLSAAPGHIPGGEPEVPARNEVILNYDGPNNDAIGLTAGGTFHVAARFPSSMVGQYAGYVLTSVEVYINDLPSGANLKIWGAGSGTAPGAVLHQQTFTSSASSWVDVQLSNPVLIDGTDIWVGYEVTHGAGQYPAGCDAGPANPNGDWISIDGTVWEHLAGYGLNYNWNIRATLNPGEGLWLSVSPTSGNVAPGGSQILTAEFDATGLEIREYTANINISSNDPGNPTVVVPVLLDVLIGINEVDREAVMVYPVPAADVLNVVTSQGIRNVRMFSYTGQMVYEANITGESTLSIDVKPFHTGAYILQFITADGQSYNKRIIISR